MAKNKDRVDLRTLGNTGLERSAGRIYEEFLPELSGHRKNKVFEEMANNDSIVGAILFAVEMMIRQVDWRVQPASENRTDIEAAEFLESCMEDMSMTWQDMIAEIMSMLTYGWSFHEIVYKRRLGNSKNPKYKSKYKDGLIGWRKISIRAQDTLHRWEFDESGDVKAMQQIPPPNYNIKRIPIEKALLFRTSTAKNNPEGRSILRNAYRAWYFKKNIQEIEGIGIERDLAGLPVAWIPPELLDPDASSEDKAIKSEIERIITNVRRDEQEGIMFPLAYDDDGNKLYDLELMNSGGDRQFDTNEIIQRYDQRIAMTVLADFILLGSKNVGSWSLASSKTDLFTTALGAWLDEIKQTFNRYAIPRLFELNGFKVEKLPKLEYGDIEHIDLETLSNFIKNMSGAGAMLFPDDKLEDYLLNLANLPTSEHEGGL